jgi:hypothetical protein
VEPEPYVIESTHRLEPRAVLEDTVLSLVASANQQVPSARKIERRYVYEALHRAMDRTALLFTQPEVREINVMREVSDFVKVATFGSEPKFCQDYLDLLPVGHPLSQRSIGTLSAEDVVEHGILWRAGDPRVSDEHRPLVASAFRAAPNSVERKFLAARLDGLPSEEIPKDLLVHLIEE